MGGDRRGGPRSLMDSSSYLWCCAIQAPPFRGRGAFEGAGSACRRSLSLSVSLARRGAATDHGMDASGGRGRGCPASSLSLQCPDDQRGPIRPDLVWCYLDDLPSWSSGLVTERRGWKGEKT